MKQFGSEPVKLDWEVDPDRYTPEVIGLLDEVYSVYGQFSALRLRNITHDEPPWRETPNGEVISHGLMKDYFKTQITK